MGQIALFQYLESQHMEKGVLYVAPRSNSQWIDIGETHYSFSCLPLGQQNMVISSQQDKLM